MIKFPISSLLGIVGVCSCWGSIAWASPIKPNVQLTTQPPVEQIVPNQQPVQLKFQAVDDRGNLVKNAKLRLQIFTPAKTPWFSSDFPIVEGTQLLNLEAIAPTGKLDLQQVFPIRGQYQLVVDVAPIDGKSFTASQQKLTISVSENSIKYRNLAILAVILLTVGIGGGWVIGERQPTEPGEIAPQKVRLLLSGGIVVAIASLLIINISAEFAEADHHHHHSHSHSHAEDNSSSPSRLQVRWLGDDSATVGELAQMGVQVSDSQTGKPATDVVFNIKAIQTEHDETVLAFQGVPNASGKFAWRQQFFDGATHKVEVEVVQNANLQLPPVKSSQEIEVEGVAPPLHSRLITLTYLTSILVAGLLLGLKLRRDRSPSPMDSAASKI